MKGMEWKNWIGKKVFIRTRSMKFYSGVVLSFDDGGDDRLLFLTIRDKFGAEVCFAISEIVELKDEGDGDGRGE